MTTAPVVAICCGGLVSCVAATFLTDYFGSRRFPLPTATGRLGCVDGLRGYLATFVMIYHFILYVQVTRLGGIWSRPSLGFFDSLGPGSVNLFFMTTGFLFYPRILNGITLVDWPTVYISRVFRIIPLLIFLVFAASLLIMVRLDFHSSAPLRDTALAMIRWTICWDQPDLFGYRNSGQLGSVLWSLWFEWLFYIFVLPACAVAMAFRGRAPTWTVPAGLVFLSVGLRPLHLTPLIDFLPLFGIGMIAFEIKNRPVVLEAMRTPFANVAAFSCLFAGAVVASGPARIALHGVFFICIASGCSLWGLLRTRGARVLGEISYGIYVLHMLILNLLFVSFARGLGYFATAALPALLPAVALAVVTSAAAAYLSVERPGIRLGKAIAREVSSWIKSRRNGSSEIEGAGDAAAAG